MSEICLSSLPSASAAVKDLMSAFSMSTCACMSVQPTTRQGLSTPALEKQSRCRGRASCISTCRPPCRRGSAPRAFRRGLAGSWSGAAWRSRTPSGRRSPAPPAPAANPAPAPDQSEQCAAHRQSPFVSPPCSVVGRRPDAGRIAPVYPARRRRQAPDATAEIRISPCARVAQRLRQAEQVEQREQGEEARAPPPPRRPRCPARPSAARRRSRRRRWPAVRGPCRHRPRRRRTRRA